MAAVIILLVLQHALCQAGKYFFFFLEHIVVPLHMACTAHGQLHT